MDNSRKISVLQSNGGDVPTVRIQAGTPLPSIPVAEKRQPVNNVPKQSDVNLPSILTKNQPWPQPPPSYASVATAQYAPAFPIKKEPLEYVLSETRRSVGGAVPAPPNPYTTNGPAIFKKPSLSSIHSPSLQSVRMDNLNLRLPDHMAANHSPTPSDISSIRMTPHHAITPTLDRQAIGSPRTPLSDRPHNFLEPNLTHRPDWNTFKILPGLHNGHAGSVSSLGIENGDGYNQPGSSLSQYPISNVSLSPFPQLDFSPAPSMFSSPRHSARSQKKRALSVSPLSADGIDINSIIRTSPTSLVAYINNSSRNSSANKTRTSPFSNATGNHGHLIARPTLSLDQWNNTNIEQLRMAALEQSNTRAREHPNQVVLHQQHVHLVEGTITYKQETVFPSENKLHPRNNLTVNNSFPTTDDLTQGQGDASNIGLYHPEQQMQQLSARPPLLPRAQNQSTPRRPPVHPAAPVSQSYSSAAELHGAAATALLDDSENEEEEDESDTPVKQCRWIDCDSVFNDKEELVRHVEKSHIDHRKGEEFTCFWGGCKREHKPFNARYKLLIHMRVHTGERPNKCTHPGCDKSFSRLENLKIHLRSHTGEKPYKCTFESCNKSFSNSSDRAKHQRTHIDTKPYACQVPGCTKRYTDPSSLRKHVKNHKQAEQQQRKKLKSNESGYSSEGLGDCLNITRLRPEGSPMSVDSHGSLPGTRTDFYPAIYSSAHSSRSGTANGGYSHQPSPISMHSMVSSPHAPPVQHSPYPVQNSPARIHLQPSPSAYHMVPSPGLSHSPLPPNYHQHNSLTPNPVVDYSYSNRSFPASHSVLPPIMATAMAGDQSQHKCRECGSVSRAGEFPDSNGNMLSYQHGPNVYQNMPFGSQMNLPHSMGGGYDMQQDMNRQIKSAMFNPNYDEQAHGYQNRMAGHMTSQHPNYYPTMNDGQVSSLNMGINSHYLHLQSHDPRSHSRLSPALSMDTQ